MDELREVLSGSEPDGVEWTILAGNADDWDNFWTFVRRSQRGGPVAQSGMGGPKLYADAPVNLWAGQADGSPPFVLLRAAPAVERAAVITTRGARRELTLSSVVDEFGLRFAAGPLPEDGEPFTLEVEVPGKGVLRLEVPWP